jgi:hypothetical protein
MRSSEKKRFLDPKSAFQLPLPKLFIKICRFVYLITNNFTSTKLIMLFLTKLFFFLASLGLALSACEYTDSHAAKSVISKGETVQDVTACSAYTYSTQALTVWVNATSNCQVYVCKRSAPLLKLSQVLEIQSNVITNIEIPLGMGGVNADLELCKIGNEKVYFSEYRLQFYY